MSRTLLPSPYPKGIHMVKLGFKKPSNSFHIAIFLGLGPMPFALALELKFENSSVAAKNGIDIQFLSCVNLFFIASFRTANENVEIEESDLIIETNQMVVPIFS